MAGSASSSAAAGRPSRVRATAAAAFRGLLLFLLLRIALVHLAMLLLAISGPPVPPATPATREGGEGRLGGTKKVPKPVVKTVTTTVVQQRKLTVLTDGQRAQIDAELASFAAQLREESEVADGAANERLAEIERALDELDSLSRNLREILLPRAARAEEELRSRLDEVVAGARLDEERRAGLNDPSSGASAGEQRYRKELLPRLVDLMNVSSYAHWSDEELEATLGAVAEELQGLGDERDIVLADLGAITQSIIGGGDIDGSYEQGCDPAFLERGPPESCGDDMDSAGGRECATEYVNEDDVSGDIARESDLSPLVASIEETLRDRIERFDGILAGTSKHELGTVGPLTEPSAVRRFKEAVTKVVAEANAKIEAEKKRRQAVVRDRVDEGSGSEDVSNCASEEDIEFIVQKALEAYQSNRDLKDELIGALRVLYEERGEVFDPDSIHWEEEDEPEENNQSMSTPHPHGKDSKDASFLHRGTLRAWVDTQAFHDAIEKLDVLADAVGGYNEGVDRIIDFIAGDEKEGGSVSMTVKRAVLDLFGRVPIPAQFDEWKKEAGVLYDGSI